jgi:hypothetical protein
MGESVCGGRDEETERRRDGERKESVVETGEFFRN